MSTVIAAAPENTTLRLRWIVSRVTSSRWLMPVVLTVLIVGGTTLLWWRLGAVTRATMWAEDARIFTRQAYENGPLTDLFRPYAGYLQVVPRLVAAVTVVFAPLRDWALSMAFGSCFVVACCSAVVAVCARQVLRSLPLGLAAALLTLLDPLAPREVLGNTANLHWYAIWMTPWLLLYRPRSRITVGVLSVVMLLAGLSEIQLIVFLPLLGWLWRDKMRLPVRIAMLVTVVAEIIVTIVSPRSAGTQAPISLESLAFGYLINCVATIFEPNANQLGSLLRSSGVLVPTIMLLPFLAAFAYCLWWGRVIDRILAVTFLGGSVVLYVVAIEISPGRFYNYAGPRYDLAYPWLTRYGVVPSMFLLSLVLLAAAVASRVMRSRSIPMAAVTASPPSNAAAAAPSDIVAPAASGASGAETQSGFAQVIRSKIRFRRRPAIIGGVAVILVLGLLLPHLRLNYSRRMHGPEWASQVEAEKNDCAHESPNTIVHLRAQPGPGWYVPVTCRALNTER